MIVLMLACMPCPDGLEREKGGQCLPAGGGPVGEGVPPTEEQFLRLFDETFCDELEDCWCDAYELDTCDPALDCPHYVAPVGCVYDEAQAEECLHGRFDCDADPDLVVVTAPDACSLVYDCAGGSGTTSTPP